MLVVLALASVLAKKKPKPTPADESLRVVLR